MEILLELIENFFILWFVLVCFKVDVFKDIGKIAVVTSIATFCAMLIQQLRLIAVDESLNMLLNMVFGIILYAYLVKFFYWNEVKFFKAIGFTLIYFLVFIILGELIFVPVFYPNVDMTILDSNESLKLITTIPYRIIEAFIFFLISRIRKEKNNVKIA